MTRISSTVVLVVVSLSLAAVLVEGDTEVSCVVMETCILPCSFQDADHIVIHWTHLTTGHRVHSYFHNQDQLQHQSQGFRSGVLLFEDQISRGNASLQLTGVKVQDEGRYECFTDTINGLSDSIINLKVYAPVHEVNIQQVENRITCSSEGIYPEPELTWSTTPPSNINLHNTTTVQQNEQQLYSISSSLILSDPDLLYSCTVRTHRNKRTTTLFKRTTIDGSTTETIIPCAASNFSFSDVVWRFNHNQIIADRSCDKIPCIVSEEWRRKVKDVSESGDITLQDLSSEQEGIYTCQLSNDEETRIKSTFVRIKGNSAGVGGVTVTIIVVVAAVLVAAVGLGVCYKKSKGNKLNPCLFRTAGTQLTRSESSEYVTVTPQTSVKTEKSDDVPASEQKT